MAKGNRGGKRSGVNFNTNEQDAIEYYVSGDGMGINNLLRGRNGFTENDLDAQDRKIMKDLDSALDNNLGEQTLYRAVDASAIFGDISDLDFENLKGELIYKEFSNSKGAYSQTQLAKVNNTVNTALNKSFIDKGYVSTTRDASIAEGWQGFTGSDKDIVLKIKTSKNTKGADVSKATKRLREIESNNPQKETLLARNQKYKVNKIYGKNGCIYVDVLM